MNEQDWKALISAHLDGALSPDEAVQVEQLLAEKEECRAYLAQLQKLSMSLHVLKDEALSPDAQLKIMSNINKERPMNTHYWKGAASAFAMVVIVVLTFHQYEKTGIRARLKQSTDDIGQSHVVVRPDVRDVSILATTQEGGSSDLTPVAQPSPVPVESNATASVASTGLAKSNGLVDRTEYKADHKMEGAALQYEPYYTLSESVPAVSVSRQESLGYSERERPGVVTAYKGRAMDVAREMSPSLIYYPPVQYVRGGSEEYTRIQENQFLSAANEPLSTFGADVDTASYSNLRRYLDQRQMPPREAVRIEEMINYFSYDYPQPWMGQPFSITADLAACPWAPGHQLMRIGLKGKVPAGFSLPPSNLVFLIDVSGSMADQDKLPLLKEGFRMMAQQLRPQDRVSIVAYSDTVREVLSSVSGAEKDRIIGAINGLYPGGGTAGAQGVDAAYQVALANFISGGNNRVILATDGDFNIGQSQRWELERLIEAKRDYGIFLTVLGFGQGNIKDDRMQTLADKGNGNYAYIDSFEEAHKVLVRELGSSLFAIAKDVKVQVEFNPAAVSAYRLIGYEKRALAKEDFNDDRKDAGEIGAGHTVTALYEIVPTAVSGYYPSQARPLVDPLKYQPQARIYKIPVNGREIATVKVRYKEPQGDESKLMSRVVKFTDFNRDLKGDFAWAAAVAEFGMLLGGSANRSYASYDHVLNVARNNLGKDEDGLRSQFIHLVEMARLLDPQPMGWPVVEQGVPYQHYPVDRQQGSIDFK